MQNTESNESVSKGMLLGLRGDEIDWLAVVAVPLFVEVAHRVEADPGRSVEEVDDSGRTAANVEHSIVAEVLHRQAEFAHMSRPLGVPLSSSHSLPGEVLPVRLPCGLAPVPHLPRDYGDLLTEHYGHNISVLSR